MPTPTAQPDLHTLAPFAPPVRRRRFPAALAAAALLALALLAACDGGLAPPDAPPTGTIRGTVHYAGAWPPADSLRDLRFVAMRFVPQDTADFLELSRLVFSPHTLQRFVDHDTFVVRDVAAGAYVYSGIAQQYSPSLFAWRPVGLYEANDGVFFVSSGETTDVAITVDFRALPPFPPR